MILDRIDSEITNVIDSNISTRGMRAENRYTRPHPAPGSTIGASSKSRERVSALPEIRREGGVLYLNDGHESGEFTQLAQRKHLSMIRHWRLTRASILSGRRRICGGQGRPTSCFEPAMPIHGAGAWIDFVQSAAALESLFASDGIRSGAPRFWVDAFSSREPVSILGSSTRTCFARKRYEARNASSRRRPGHLRLWDSGFQNVNVRHKAGHDVSTELHPALSLFAGYE
jgi:hypothetical protein